VHPVFQYVPSVLHHFSDIPRANGFTAGGGHGRWLDHGLVSFYFWIDHPYNLFPSMHLSASFFAAFYCMRKGRIIGWITMIMAITVGVSVVLLKQHYIMMSRRFFCGLGLLVFSLKKIKARFVEDART